MYQNALATKAASVTARTRRHTAQEDEGRKWLRKESFGQVPAYLQTRKLELAEQHAETQVGLIPQAYFYLQACWHDAVCNHTMLQVTTPLCRRRSWLTSSLQACASCRRRSGWRCWVGCLPCEPGLTVSDACCAYMCSVMHAHPLNVPNTASAFKILRISLGQVNWGSS